MKKTMYYIMAIFCLAGLSIATPILSNILNPELTKKDRNKIIETTGTADFKIDRDVQVIEHTGENKTLIVYDFNGTDVRCWINGDFTEAELKESSESCFKEWVKKIEEKSIVVENAHKLEGKEGTVEVKR